MLVILAGKNKIMGKADGIHNADNNSIKFITHY